MDLTSFASTPNKPSQKSSWNDNQVGFVTACRDLGIRLTYGGISLLKLPEATAGLNRGRHGSNIVKSLPLAIQPVVCRQDGTYHEKAQEAFESIEGFDDEDGDYVATSKDGKLVTGLQAVMTWQLIPHKTVLGAYEAYLEDLEQTEAVEDESTED